MKTVKEKKVSELVSSIRKELKGVLQKVYELDNEFFVRNAVSRLHEADFWLSYYADFVHYEEDKKAIKER